MLVGVFVGKPQVEQSSEPVSLENWEDYYHEEVPLTKVPWYILNRYAELATALPEHGEPNPDDRLELPIDVHYYTSPNASGEPAYTIPKGTVVSLFVGGDRYLTYTQMGLRLLLLPRTIRPAGGTVSPLSRRVLRKPQAIGPTNSPSITCRPPSWKPWPQAFWEANQNSPGNPGYHGKFGPEKRSSSH